jgi:hypothetical protein
MKEGRHMPGLCLSIIRVADLPWKDRVNTDNWPSRSRMYYDNPQTGLCIRLVEYAEGATEPRHVHPGSHAATILRGRALVDGLELGPLDVVLGPSNEPHGPLHYPDGVNVFSAFLGSFFHNEVDAPDASEKQFRLIQEREIPWKRRKGASGEAKTLMDHGVGPMLVEALRFAPGDVAEANFLGAIVAEGRPKVNGETLEKWDFVLAENRAGKGKIEFPEGGMLIAVTMR